MKKRCLYVLLICTYFSCKKSNVTLFELVSPEQSGVFFTNEILENDSINILNHQYLYNGGGVGIGDFNNDGLKDIYFTGNFSPNKLYINNGGFRFTDVTQGSGTACADIWSSGVTVVDINNDGWDDIYISATFYADSTKRNNKLLINQGLRDSIPYFIDEAEAYGLADDSYTTHAVFFDYDKDEDLDVYLLVDQLLLKRSASLEPPISDGSSVNTDRLYRNNGNGSFTNVSYDAGIRYEGFGLGVAIEDINQDGWPDIYVSNDFVTNDILYINQKNGTFRNEINASLRHQSFSSMGVDIGDLDNDGLMDIMTLDMLPEDDKRLKTMFGANQFQYFEIMERNNYGLQMYRNSTQWNRGNGQFSEISQLLGTNATDWSWSVLLADFDNDADNDICITNGFPRDITDLDFINYRTGANRLLQINKSMLDQIPQVKLNNYYFENLDFLNFENKSTTAGFDIPSFSNGAAYADLDNDGDLDYIVNNINDIASIFQNNNPKKGNYIRVNLGSQKEKSKFIGSRVEVFSALGAQSKSLNPYRGYISTVELTLHFGLGDQSEVDSIIIHWPNGLKEKFDNLKINAENNLIRDSGKPMGKFPGIPQNPFFEKYTSVFDSFIHRDIQFYDFNIQKLMPHSLSQEGPGTAIGDLNNDGIQDLFVTNGRGNSPVCFLSSGDSYYRNEIIIKDLPEIISASLLDVEGDGDLDIYLCVGSTEYESGNQELIDRLLINDGTGVFVESSDLLPDLYSSSSISASCDYDKDGDIDIFIGTRSIPQSYPLKPDSYLLDNESGKFIISQKKHTSLFKELGMVTSAIWTDVDNDGWMDLMVVGEWMGITLFRNEKGVLRDQSDSFGLNNTNGWWQTISAADLNNDGLMDYVLGNQGLNNSFKVSHKEPLEIVAKDFDNNGSVDNVIFGFKDGRKVPLVLLKDLKGQLAYLQKRYGSFVDYSEADYETLFNSKERKDSYRATAQMFHSIALINRKSHFEIVPLPIAAQISPIYGIQFQDVDLDGDLDVIVAGNKFGTERMSGKHDASVGLLMLNDGKGNLTSVSPVRSGLYMIGDVKSLNQMLSADGSILLIGGTNNGHLQSFKWKGMPNSTVNMMPVNAQYGIVHFNNGHIQKIENGTTHGYGSSSCPFIVNAPEIKNIQYFDMNGKEIGR